MRIVQPWSALALTLGAAVAGCGRSAAANSETGDNAAARVEGDHLVLRPGDPQVASLTTTPAVDAGADSLRLPGRLVWNEDATVRVFSPFAGRVSRIVGEVGQQVRAGDPLAQIVSPDFGQAQADGRRATTDVAYAERTAARARDLFEHGVAAQKDVEAAEADVARTRSEAQRARSRLAQYGADSSSIDGVFTLRAPLSGTIVDRAVTPGQEVRPDQMLASAPQLFAPLFTVTNPSRLWVIVDVPERDLPVVRQGATIVVRASAWPNRTFPGTLTLAGGAVDPSSRTVKMRGVVENPAGALKAEMLVTVSLPSPSLTGVAVPASAVILEGTTHVVYVDEHGGRYRRAVVTIGSAHGGSVNVLSGLSAGECVVTNGALLAEQLFEDAKTHP